MATRRNPTARQVRLGTELRRMRDAAGLKATQAAALLGTSSAQISQIESGIAGVSEDRLRRLAAHYACTNHELIDALVALATERTQGWWEKYRGLLATAFLDLAELEHHATYRHNVEFLHIPGLLQTEEYSRAIFSYRVPELPYAELELRVRHRMDRKVAIEGPDPVPYTAVIHESALRIRVGDRAAARTQLTSVLEHSEADHITVRVIPFDLDGFAGATSGMTYAGGPVPKLDTALRDTPHGTAFIDAEAQLGALRTLFRKVEAVALEPERSRDFIHRLMKEL
ncbi:MULTISPECIES: helix-turn-helix domain-containing protein [Streptomyces]|uniref:Helix-turn-helix transcriptional regulator n=1 Tax=Streptomyces caniscabiei TaxID=2746961 RepID=A0ABU4MNJ2_9ACTN|nr:MULTISPECIES: helix-turn-helix transcriptional regulator [Streptomyces]MBE4739916.1 helix-turn-helix transcriptional regulator [Streptomyces caniscabiei]MBE4758806.1 helix-turn-helix transcriptional regulator [Streptomyces caniscabiei]MBE4770093.1 helix-turn-helix transcriptional regulator [Streptomyces caniscabiei]MBE4785238.1 helix-turn-helix transcriptional regulator [Streptomyces caniscabiei]MBE4797657.1 helix-turn-helix transcriptional regulator [Streptomyces caniscabiei]